MGFFTGWLADVFLADGSDVPDPAPRDLTAAYRAEFPGFQGDKVLVLYPWGGRVREALHAFKYDGARAVGAAMARGLAKNLAPRAGGTVVTFVPGRPFRYFLRGYNPSRVLAAGYARAAGLPCRALLAKSRSGAHQAGLGREERLKNLAGAFFVPAGGVGSVRGADVALVDDVVTTGATFHEAASALKAAGAKSVTGIFVTSTTA